MGLDTWQSVGIIAGALLAAITLLAVLVRGARRFLKTVLGTSRQINQIYDDLLGDKHRGIPSITDRVKTLDSKLDEHLRWHSPMRNGQQAATTKRGEYRG